MNFKYDEALKLSKLLMAPKTPTGKYSFGGQQVSYEALNAALSQQLTDIAGTPRLFRKNRDLVCSLLEETLDVVTPKNVMDTYGMFADVQIIGQGDQAVFTKSIGKTRAKQFITRVGLAGRYEAFELGQERMTVQTTAYGGAARIGIEEFLDGRVQWSDYLDIINEGMSEAIYKEIEIALKAAIQSFPATNKVSAAAFDETQFDRLIQTISVYGSPTIYCTLEGAMTLLPSNNWISENMKDARWQNGYFTTYKGTPVVVLPQSFTDETNATKVIDPAYIYIFPTGGGKPVKIAMEGQTLVREKENDDWSRTLYTYQKFGVGVMTTNNLAVFKNTSLTLDNIAGPWTP